MRTASDDMAERLTDLEMRCAHQEKTITELSDMMSEQWKKIDNLERQLRRLNDEVQLLDGGDAPPNQKPPHY